MRLSEIPLFPIMELDTAKYGKIDFGPGFADRLIAHAERRVLKVDPFIDTDHQGGRAFGWIKRVYRGQFATPAGKTVDAVMADVDWTGAGEEAIRSGEFRYISPEIGEYKDEETGEVIYPVLKSAALTNTPVLKLMPAVTLSDKGKQVSKAPLTVPLELPAFELDEASADAGALLHPLLAELDALMAKGEASWAKLPGARTLRTYLKEVRAKLAAMNLRQIEASETNPEGGKRMEELLKLLELSEGAGEADIVAKLREVTGAKDKELADLKAAKEATDKELAELKGSVSSKDKEFAEAVKRLSTLEVTLAERDRDTFIERALADGKIVPASKETWEKLYMADAKLAAETLETIKPAVDLGEHGSGAGGGQAPANAFMAEIRKVTDANPDMSFIDAMAKVQAAHPEMAREYLEGVR